MRFLFKSREEMEEEDQEIIKSINETPVKKATKRRKLSEEAQEAEDLRKRLELFLLVERRYPLSRFTLEQLVNVTRLQVEEESEMSLELLRFTRQQLQEYQQGLWLNTSSMKLRINNEIKLVEQRQKLNV
nr:hypothetical protein [Tanacetum cinerariifolium]